ncbi:hypothetical protein BKA80DRAFT_236860 [Phyllosticta citrichinensis]
MRTEGSTRARPQAHVYTQVEPMRQLDQAPTSPNVAPPAPDRRNDSSATAPVRRGRGSVSHRSPLQKLEGALDNISKEERRARVADAEARAEDRLAARRASEQHEYSRTRTRHFSSAAAPEPAVERVPSDRRNVPMPEPVPSASNRPQKDTDEGTIRRKPVGQDQHIIQPSSRGAQRKQEAYSTENRGKRAAVPANGPGRSVKFREPDANTPHSSGPTAVATSAGIALAGIDGPNEHRQEPQPAIGRNGSVGRSNSRKLQKRNVPQEYHKPLANRDNGKAPDAYRQLSSDRMGHSQGARAAETYHESDPVPREVVRKPVSEGPRYEVPPQTAGARRAQDKVGFNQEDPAAVAADREEQGHRHLSGLFHRHHSEERRYAPFKGLDDWKTADKAILTADDLNVDGDSETDLAQAWWERTGSHRRRTSQTGIASAQYDGLNGSYDDQTGQTRFNPTLYMKCGPLLRYTGMKRESRMGRNDRWFWRGSVMIVTIDRYSNYDTPPVLRLFVQSKFLLPPPPAELDESNGQKLASEYVDPLAGEAKVSRTGKTLYVRPVEDLEEGIDLSTREDDTGLFELSRSASNNRSRISRKDGEKAGKFREVKAARLHAERGVTFWRFNIEVELGKVQSRLAYRINRGPAIGFWVPARGETMNIMFHSCNGFSLSVDPNQFCGPDPMWRDVLNNHQTRPFHVMIGGGDQIYNDKSTQATTYFKEWLATKNAMTKHAAQFTPEMQDELEQFYLDRYAMWFSQGLFGMAASQIPMVNMWDDHDIIDGFGSYPHHFMKNPVFCGLGAVAFKYYMLFQHQSVPDETERQEESWLLGAAPGPYINQLSRNIFMFLGKNVAFLGLDCRTERMRDEVLSEDSYYKIFERCRREIRKGETKHLIVLLGVPIAYPRLNFLENLLTSRVMDPIKALGRTGMLGGFVNKFDGGVEILDDLDDHWTAKHHKAERNWFIQELQELAADKSVRVTILGGDVHLAAVGQFYSKKRLHIPKDRDHRYMPNIISSAIVNTPPPELMGDILNKRNKIHHLDEDTDEDMIPMFTHDVDGKPRNNHHLLPRRNWCSLREYRPGTTPPPTPSQRARSLDGSFAEEAHVRRTGSMTRNDFKPSNIIRRISGRGPPPSFYNDSRRQRSVSFDGTANSRTGNFNQMTLPTAMATGSQPQLNRPAADPPRPNPFHRRPTGLSIKAARKGGPFDPDAGYDSDDPDNVAGAINLEHGLDVVLNLEVSQHDPAGITAPYRLLIPALEYHGPVKESVDELMKKRPAGAGFKGFFGSFGGQGGRKGSGRGERDSYIDSRDASPLSDEPRTSDHHMDTSHRRTRSRSRSRSRTRDLGGDGTFGLRERDTHASNGVSRRPRSPPATQLPAPAPGEPNIEYGQGPIYGTNRNLQRADPAREGRYLSSDSLPQTHHNANPNANIPRRSTSASMRSWDAEDDRGGLGSGRGRGFKDAFGEVKQELRGGLRALSAGLRRPSASRERGFVVERRGDRAVLGDRGIPGEEVGGTERVLNGGGGGVGGGAARTSMAQTRDYGGADGVEEPSGTAATQDKRRGSGGWKVWR